MRRNTTVTTDVANVHAGIASARLGVLAVVIVATLALSGCIFFGEDSRDVSPPKSGIKDVEDVADLDLSGKFTIKGDYFKFEGGTMTFSCASCPGDTVVTKKPYKLVRGNRLNFAVLFGGKNQNWAIFDEDEDELDGETFYIGNQSDKPGLAFSRCEGPEGSVEGLYVPKNRYIGFGPDDIVTEVGVGKGKLKEEKGTFKVDGKALTMKLGQTTYKAELSGDGFKLKNGTSPDAETLEWAKCKF